MHTSQKEETTMAAYLIFALDITDPEGFREYAEHVGPTHEHFGGKLLVPRSICETLEGEWHPNRLAMLEFESVEQARRWYTFGGVRTAQRHPSQDGQHPALFGRGSLTRERPVEGSTGVICPTSWVT